MRSKGLARAVKLLLVGLRETGSALHDAFQAVSAEMAAYDAGVDPASVREAELPSRRQAQTVRGPYHRRGPMDDGAPIEL